MNKTYKVYLIKNLNIKELNLSRFAVVGVLAQRHQQQIILAMDFLFVFLNGILFAEKQLGL